MNSALQPVRTPSPSSSMAHCPSVRDEFLGSRRSENHPVLIHLPPDRLDCARDVQDGSVKRKRSFTPIPDITGSGAALETALTALAKRYRAFPVLEPNSKRQRIGPIMNKRLHLGYPLDMGIPFQAKGSDEESAVTSVSSVVSSQSVSSHETSTEPSLGPIGFPGSHHESSSTLASNGSTDHEATIERRFEELVEGFRSVSVIDRELVMNRATLIAIPSVKRPHSTGTLPPVSDESLSFSVHSDRSAFRRVTPS